MAANPPNLFQELQSVLTTFKEFLDQNVGTIKTAITPLKAIIPQITELITKLIDLMGKLKTEVEHLDVGALTQGVNTVSQFTSSARTLLQTAKTLLPNDAATIDEILDIVNVVSSLPTLSQFKDTITGLITAITTHLETLKSA
jgi:phage-related protein